MYYVRLKSVSICTAGVKVNLGTNVKISVTLLQSCNDLGLMWVKLHVQAFLASRETVTNAQYMSGSGSIFA
jgi:hypothetical protein